MQRDPYGNIFYFDEIDGGLKKHPDDWTLQLAKAALDHDENNFHQEVAKSSEYSEKRSQSLASFQKAAALYAAQINDLSEDKEITKVYELWYYASLGACDLQQVREESLPDLRQPALIREAILSLDDEAAERHLAMFANRLFTRMSGVKPAVKFRYLKSGFDIVGDQKQAREARTVFDYYNDLVTEIKLETVVDGTDVVGHQQPFGLLSISATRLKSNVNRAALGAICRTRTPAARSVTITAGRLKTIETSSRRSFSRR